MLIALAHSMLLGSGNVEIFSRSDFREVGQVIEDAQRAEQVGGSMERINAELEALAAVRDAEFERFKNVDDLVGATLADYKQTMDPLWQARREAQAVYIDEVFAMRKNLSRDEWGRMFGADR